MAADFDILTRGMEIPCAGAVYRPAVKAPHGLFSKRTSPDPVAASIVAEYPRRWRKSRGCKVRTAGGEFLATAIPHHDGMIRLEGKNIDAIAVTAGIDRS